MHYELCIVLGVPAIAVGLSAISLLAMSPYRTQTSFPKPIPKTHSQNPFPKPVPDSLAKDAAPIPNATCKKRIVPVETRQCNMP